MDVVSSALAVCLVALVVVGVALRDRWQQWWFELEDPRPIAAFRIAFAILLLCNVNGLHEWFELLFLPAGMFTAAEARAAFPNEFSILYFVDAFWIVLVLFELAALLFLVGLYTRVTGIVTLVLFDTILCRNLVFWEGTELVFRVFLVYLVCSRCGEAYSVDAWRRGTAPALVPAWPRRLMMVQLAILFVTTGLLKHGAWLDGTAVYYALGNEHYARFRLEPLLGNGIAVGLTVLARSIEVAFPFALVGIVGAWSATRFAPVQGRTRTIVGLALAVALTCSSVIVAITGVPRILPIASTELAVASWIAVFAGSAWLWTRTPELARRVFAPKIFVVAAALLLLGMWLLMNIGWFHAAVLATLIPFVAAVPTTPQPLAYSPRTRTIAGLLLAWHLVAIVVVNIPDDERSAAFRNRIGVLAGPWLAATRTAQQWGMWADAPRQNVFLAAALVDTDGNTTHIVERGPSSPFGYDRFWKIAGRIGASDPETSPYPAAYARWLCREHAGTKAVALRTITTNIPRDDASAEPSSLLLERSCD